MRVIIAGCGWLGQALALALVERGDDVVGIRRSPAGCAELEHLGIASVQADLADPAAISLLPALVHGARAIVACQAAGGGTEETYRRAYLDVTTNLLQFVRGAGIPRLVYTGSTGVFGHDGGEDVDEHTRPRPTRPTAQILADTERRVLDGNGDGLATSVVRLSGLYGPGRYGVIERVRSGRLALGELDDAWMNWCHRADAVRAVLAALDRGRGGGVYHGSDACPSRRATVVRWISERIGIEPPRAPDTSPARPGRRANRRILAEHTRSELGFELAYPSFREGLAEILDAINPA